MKPAIFLFMETWKDIEWFEWLYEVSSLWRVKSLNYHKSWKEQILKPINQKKYSGVVLCNSNIEKRERINRLVAIAFIPNPLNLPYVLHKIETLDENGFLYNWADNLFWWTQKDNMRDMCKKWRGNFYFQKHNPTKWKYWSESHCSRSVLQYTLSLELVNEFWSLIDVQNKLWISSSNIAKCCKWKKKTAWWFIWQYKYLQNRQEWI